AAILRNKESRRLDTAIKRVGVVLAAGRDLPDLLQRGAGAFRKFDIRLFGIGPVLPEVIARAQLRTPMKAARASPDAVSPVAFVVCHCVDRTAGKIRSSDFPLRSLLVRAKDEGTFHRPDEKKEITFARLDMTDLRHASI